MTSQSKGTFVWFKVICKLSASLAAVVQKHQQLIIGGKNVSALYISLRHRGVTFRMAPAKNFTPCLFYSLWNRTAKFSLRAPKIMQDNKKIMALGRTSAAVVHSF